MLFASTRPSKSLVGTLQARTLSSVVFPAPEAPIMAVTSPALNMPDTPFSSCLVIMFFLQGMEGPW